MASFLETCHLPDCGLPANYTCSKCVTVGYCSSEHQRTEWKAHKPNCGHLAIVYKIEEVYKNAVTLSGREHIDTLYRLYNDLKYFYRLLFIQFKEGRLIMRNNTFNIDSELSKFEREIQFIDKLYGVSNNILDDLRNSNININIVISNKLSSLYLIFYHRIAKSIVFLSSILYKYSTPPVNMTIFASGTNEIVDLLIYNSIATYGIINHPINTNTSLSDRLDIIKRAFQHTKNISSLYSVSALLQTKIAERETALDGGRRKTRRRR